MTVFDLILGAVSILVGLPVLAYLVMKLGTAGYLRAKWRAQNNKETKTNEIEE